MRREEDYDMRKMHSPLFLKMFYTLLFTVMFGLCGCGGGGGGGIAVPAQKPAESIVVKPANNVVYPGTTIQYTLESSYTGVFTSSVVWDSTNKSVATISSSGMVNCIAVGETDITATLGGGLTPYKTHLKVIATTVPSGSGVNLNVAGRWVGTYEILDAVDTNEIGKTYTYEFNLTQNGTTVTGQSSLRRSTPRFAVGEFLEASVAGDILKFVFKYTDPVSKTEIETNSGSAQIITDTSLTGEAVENDSKGWNCHYKFVLTKQP